MGDDNVKVCVRARPLIQRETSGNNTTYWKFDKHSMSQIDNNKSFIFDRVFSPSEQTSDVFNEVAKPIVQATVKGYNGTIFAYGQTSSGKTFTMMGSDDCPGIIPLAINELFDIIQHLPSREFLLRVSYLEIYNETISDLLSKDKKKKLLDIHEDITKTVYVADLREEVVTNMKDLLEIMRIGEKNRHYGETKMNQCSSRSHTIFRLIIESRERSQRESMDGAIAVSHLNLVDLAGSERTSQTGAEGLRLKEGCNINRSLFILGQVIKKLSENPSGGAFLNFRDSKLTRILQNSLGGNAKTLILCTVTPAANEETLSTLMFASTAKHMKNSAHVNEVIDDQAMLKRCRREISSLKQMLEQMNQAQTQQLVDSQQQQKDNEERIQSLKHMIINYGFIGASATNDFVPARPKRRETWCPGLLRLQAKKLRGNMTETPDVDYIDSLDSVSVRRKCDSSSTTLVDEIEEDFEGEWLQNIPLEANFSQGKLQAKVGELEERLQEANLKEAERNGQMMAVIDENDMLRQQLSTLEAKLKALEAERQHAEAGKHNSAPEAAGALWDDLATSNSASGPQLNAVKDENDLTGTPLALQLNVHDYEEQISALKARVAICEEENSRFRNSAMEMENITHNLQSGLSDLGTESIKVGELVENLSPTEKDALDGSCEASKKSPINAILAEDNASLKLQRETSVEEEQTERADTSSRLLDCELKPLVMDARNADLANELNAKIRGLDKLTASLKSHDEELSLQMTQHDKDGPTAMQQMEEKLTHLERQVVEMRAQNQDLATELTLKELNLQKAKESLEASDEKISNLQLFGDGAKTEIELLKVLLEQKSEAHNQQASSTMEERMQMDSLREEAEQLREQLQIALEAKEHAGNSSPDMEASEAAVTRLSSLEKECEMLQGKLRNTTTELNTVASVLDENRLLQTKLENENQNLQDKVVNMSLEYERETCCNKTLKSEIYAFQQQARESKEENNRLMEQSKDFSEMNARLQCFVQEAQQQSSLLMDKVEKLTEESNRLKLQLQMATTMSEPAQESFGQSSEKELQGHRLTRRSSMLTAKMELSFDDCDYRFLNSHQVANTGSIIAENLAEVELERLRGRLASLEEENQSLLALLPPIPKEPKEDTDNGVADLLAKLSTLEEENCQLKAALDAKTRELGSVLDEAATIRKPLKSAEKEVENLQILDTLNEESVNQSLLSTGEKDKLYAMKLENECLTKQLQALLAQASEGDRVMSNEAVVKLEVNLRTLEEEKTKLQVQLESVQAECEALTISTNENDGIDERLRAVEEDKRHLESELESTRLQNEQLSNLVMTLSSAQAKLQEVDHENAQLRDQLDSACALDDQLSVALEKILELNEKLLSVKIEEQGLRAQVASLQNEGNKLSTASDITALNEKLQLLQDNKKALQSQFEDAVLHSGISDKLKVRPAMMQNEKQCLLSKISSFAIEQADQYLMTSQEISALEEKNCLLENEKKMLQAVLDSDRKRVEELSTETEVASLKFRFQELWDQNEVLRSQLESAHVQCQQLSGCSDEVGNLKSRFDKIVENVMKPSCRNSGLNFHQLPASSDEVAVLKVELQELQDEREQMRSHLKYLRLYCEHLSSASDELVDLKTSLQLMEHEKELPQTQRSCSTPFQEVSTSSENADKYPALIEKLELLEVERGKLHSQLDSAKAQRDVWSNEISTLKHNLQKLQDEKEQLESQSDSLRQQCEQLMAACDELADVKTKLEVLQKESADVKTQLQVLEEERDLLQTQLHSSTHSEELDDKLVNAAEEMSALKERLQLVEGEKHGLKVQLASAKTQEDERSAIMSTLNHNLQKLQDEKEQLESQSDSLRQQCEQLMAACDELADVKTKLEVLQKESADVKTQLQVLEEERDLLQTQLHSSTHSEELDDKLVNAAEEMSALKERLQLVEGEKHGLQVQLASAKTQEDERSAIMSTLNHNLQKLQDEKEQLESQSDSLRQQCEQLMAACDELADVKTKLGVLQKESADVKTQLQVLEEERDLLQTQLHSSTHSEELNDKLVNAAEEISALKERLQLVEGETHGLHVQLASAKTQEDERSAIMSTLNHNLQKLQDEKEQLESQSDSLRQQCEQLMAACDELADVKTKLGVLQKESADVKTQLQELEEERDLLQTQLHSSTHSEELNDKLVNAAEEISALKERLQLVEGETHGLHVQLASAKTQQDERSAEISTLNNNLQHLQNEKEQLEFQMGFLQQRCAQLSTVSDELEDLTVKHRVIENERTMLQQQWDHRNKEMSAMECNLALQGSIDAFKIQKDLLSTASDAITTLEAALEALQVERKELKSQIDFARSQCERLSCASEETISLQSKLEEVVVKSEHLKCHLESVNDQLEKLSHVNLQLEQIRSALGALQGKTAHTQKLLGCDDFTVRSEEEEEENSLVGTTLPSTEMGQRDSGDSLRDSGIEAGVSRHMTMHCSNRPLIEDEQLSMYNEQGGVDFIEAAGTTTLMKELHAESDGLRRSLEDLKEEFVRVQSERRRSSHKHLNQEQHLENQLLESIQLCESLLLEKKELEVQLEEKARFVEQLQQDLRTTEIELQDLHELQEFENLETKTEQEVQLTHELQQLKKLVQQGEEYNQELEVDLKKMSQELCCKEEDIQKLQGKILQMTKEQQWETEVSTSSDTQKLREHVKTLRKSLEDAETVTKDSTKQAAILRTENLSLKEQMADIQVRLRALTSEAENCRSLLEQEKKRYCTMERDLQRDLNSVYADHARLSQLLGGKVPKDLQMRYELEKQLQQVKARLQSVMDERDRLQAETSRKDEADILALERTTRTQEMSELNETLSLTMAERDQLAANLEAVARERDYLQQRATVLEEALASEKEKVATEKEISRQQELILTEDATPIEAELSRSALKSSVQHHTTNTTLTEQLTDLEEKLHRVILQRDELSTRVDALVAERESLMAERGSLESALLEQEAGAREEHARLSREVAGLNEQLDALAKEKAALELSLLEVTAQRDEMQKDIHDNVDSAIQIQSELLQLQGKLKASQIQHKDMDKALQEKSNEIVRLQTRLMEAQSSGQELSAHCAKMSADQASQEALVEQLQGSLSEEQQRMLDAEQRRMALAEELRALRCSSGDLQNEVQLLSRQVAELQQQLTHAQEENSKFVAEATHHVKELNFQTLQSEQYRKLIDDADAELEEEKKRTEELLARVASLESQLQAAMANGRAGQSDSDELQELREKFAEAEASLKSELTAAKDQADVLRQRVAVLESEARGHGSQLEAAGVGQSTGTSESQEQLEMLKEEVKMLTMQSEYFMKLIDDSDAELEEVKKQKEELQAHVAFLESQLQAAKANGRAGQSDSGELQQRREKLVEADASLKFNKAIMSSNKKAFGEQLEGLQSELAAAKDQADVLRQRVAVLESEARGHGSQLEAAGVGQSTDPSESQEQLEMLKEEVKMLTTQSDRFMKLMDDADAELEEEKKRKEELLARVALLESQLQAAMANGRAGQSDSGELQELREKLVEAQASLKSELTVAKDQADVLRQRVAVLESEARGHGSQLEAAGVGQSTGTSESQEQLEMLKEEVKMLTMQSEYFMKLIDDSDAELEEVKKQKEELQAHVAFLKSQLQAAKANGRAGQSDSGELQQRREKLVEADSSLEFNKEIMGSDEKAFGEKVQHLQSEFTAEKHQVDVLRQRVAMLESEARELGSQLEAAHAEHRTDTSESQRQLETLNEEVKELHELLTSSSHGKKETATVEATLRTRMAEMASRESVLEQRVMRRDAQLSDLNKRMQMLMKSNQLDAEGKESTDVKYELVKLQMEKYKLENAHEKEVNTLKMSLDIKAQTIMKLKKDLRMTRHWTDTTFSEASQSTSSGIITCGGGSGVIQGTAIIVLQNENRRLRQQLQQLKHKLTSIKDGTLVLRLRDATAKYKQETEALREKVKELQRLLEEQKAEESSAVPARTPQLLPVPPTASGVSVSGLRTPTKHAIGIENKTPLSPRKNLMMPHPKKHFFEPGATVTRPSNIKYFDNSTLDLSPQKRAPPSTAGFDEANDLWKESLQANQCKQQ